MSVFFGRKLIYILGLLALLLLLSAFQTVFWYQTIGRLSPPLLWLCIINYVILARREPQSLLLVYVLAIAASSMSSIGVGVFLIVLFSYYWLVVIVKNHFYIDSLGYFVLINFSGSAAFHIIFYVVSQLMENLGTPLLFFDRLTQVMLTPLFSVPVYWMLKKWERITRAPEIYMDTSRYEYE
ncbi:MAG: hypothetical protein ACK5V3_13185 [Bdellovibrionales bacterium]